MEPKYVTFEQAKWLKEKGYEIDTDEVLFCRDEINNIEEHQIKNRAVIYNGGISYIVDEDEYRVYEQHQVVEWLRVEHDIWIGVMPDVGMDLIYTYKIYSVEVGGERCLANGNNYDTPHEAYSAAFDYIKDNDLI
jgi:hypothetical protein